MSVPTRYSPKRLQDYTLRGGKTRPVTSNMSTGKLFTRSGPTTAERDKAARDKSKALIVADIQASDARRKGLEAMWTREQERVTSARKSAIEDYKTVMDTAPDFEDDTEGTLRAAWENQPHVRAVKDRMRAHIEASMASSRPARVDTGPQGKKTITNRPPQPKAQPVQPDVGEPPKEEPKRKEITVRLPNGSKGTVVGKNKNKVKVMDRRTREVKEYTTDQLEVLERKGLDPLTDMPA